MKILAIIPARGGSKGIPFKNIKLLNGKPLIEYTTEVALSSKYINRVILSTESIEFAKIGRKLGVEVPFLRPTELAKDDTPTLHVIKNVVAELEKLDQFIPDVIIILQPTSPLRTLDDLNNAIELYLNSQSDSLVSICEVPHNMTPSSILRLKENNLLDPYLSYDENHNLRQLKPKFYARNGAAIYIFSYECLINKNSLFGDSVIGYKMDKINSIDIDDEFDWEIANLFLSKLETEKQ